MLLIKFLPDRQVVAAPSPTGPTLKQPPLPAKVRERDRIAIEAGHAKVWREVGDASDCAAGWRGFGFGLELNLPSVVAEPGRESQGRRQFGHVDQSHVAFAEKTRHSRAAILRASHDRDAARQLLDCDCSAPFQFRGRAVGDAVSYRDSNHFGSGSINSRTDSRDISGKQQRSPGSNCASD